MHADDMALVQEFAASGSEQSFAALVQRHINLVYSVALRRLGDPHEAEEVTQAVFIILAKKAGSIRTGTILSGWLYQTAQLTSANFQRAAFRRRFREQEAYMQFVHQSEPDASWQRLSPLLDEAMAKLGQKERDVVVLRFFENRTVPEVASALGLQEAAAQKRVNRATDKLRRFFVKRGVQISAGALLASIGTNAVQAAPAGLASTVVTAAALKGAAVSTSTLILIKTTLKIMAWTKLKTASAAGVALLVCAGALTVAIRDRGRPLDAKAGIPASSANASFDRSTPKRTLRYLAAMLDSGDARRVAEAVQLDSGSNPQAQDAVANIVSGQTEFKRALNAKFGEANVAEALQKWRLISVPTNGLDDAQERIAGDSATVQLPGKGPLQFVRVSGNWRLILSTGNESRAIAQFNRVGKLMLDISGEVAAGKYNSPEEVFRVLQSRIMSAH